MSDYYDGDSLSNRFLLPHLDIQHLDELLHISIPGVCAEQNNSTPLDNEPKQCEWVVQQTKKDIYFCLFWIYHEYSVWTFLWTNISE